MAGSDSMLSHLTPAMQLRVQQGEIAELRAVAARQGKLLEAASLNARNLMAVVALLVERLGGSVSLPLAELEVERSLERRVEKGAVVLRAARPAPVEAPDLAP